MGVYMTRIETSCSKFSWNQPLNGHYRGIKITCNQQHQTIPLSFNLSLNMKSIEVLNSFSGQTVT